MLKIYLCDLVYDTFCTQHNIPLNIGYVAAYLKSKYPTQVDIKLFKYPKELEEALKEQAPDILGLSNYSWNERLNNVFLAMAKRLNPQVTTVMGGPNIRTDSEGIEKFLKTNKMLDYYILFEGEEPFYSLVTQILNEDDSGIPPLGVAGLVDNKLHYEYIDFKNKPKEIDLPSPYLTGILDKFLSEPDMIPLFETNRGCPFGCTYCTWGISTLSKIRTRSLDVIYEEIDYVVKKSAGQVNWIFCDANFGILKRDIEIAQKVREQMDQNSFPLNVTLWHSKNTGDRNIEIAKTIKDSNGGFIAIQSADPQVLENCGRGNIAFSHIKKQIEYYRENSIDVSTDILIGLPGETPESHIDSLRTAFDLGFSAISPYNIRMLPGSQYESAEDRGKYKIETKFRPIFGAYGIYDGQPVYEIEESVRATKDMTEIELDRFKILHWLIFFSWNTGIFKIPLKFAHKNGINPADILSKVYHSKSPLLVDLFRNMEEQSMAEWFDSKEEMISFYNKEENFDTMVNGFVKLTFSWIASIYQDSNIIATLLKELVRAINEELKDENEDILADWDDLLKIVDKIICKDILQNEFVDKFKVKKEALSYVFDDVTIPNDSPVEVEVYRPADDVAFCNYHLNTKGKKDLSIANLTRLLEMGGMKMLTNRIKLTS